MTKADTATVERKWLDNVQELLTSIKNQIKETGAPVRPGFFGVTLKNSTEVQLHDIIRDFKIHDAVEEAIHEMNEEVKKFIRIGQQVVSIVEKENGDVLTNVPATSEG